MRMCEPETASENVWHVLDVLEGSPAESAGLVPMGDWILGKHIIFRWSRVLKPHLLNRLVWRGFER